MKKVGMPYGHRFSINVCLEQYFQHLHMNPDSTNIWHRQSTFVEVFLVQHLNLSYLLESVMQFHQQILVEGDPQRTVSASLYCCTGTYLPYSFDAKLLHYLSCQSIWFSAVFCNTIVPRHLYVDLDLCSESKSGRITGAAILQQGRHNIAIFVSWPAGWYFLLTTVYASKMHLLPFQFLFWHRDHICRLQ